MSTTKPWVTARQSEVLALKAAGAWNNIEIAARLCISLKTVEAHFDQALVRTGCRTRYQLVAEWAARNAAPLPLDAMPDIILPRGLLRRFIEHVDRLEADNERLRLSRSEACTRCWTISWEPVPDEKDCIIAEHPHPEEGHMRCGHCALIEGIVEARAELRKLEEERSDA